MHWPSLPVGITRAHTNGHLVTITTINSLFILYLKHWTDYRERAIRNLWRQQQPVQCVIHDSKSSFLVLWIPNHNSICKALLGPLKVPDLTVQRFLKRSFDTIWARFVRVMPQNLNLPEPSSAPLIPPGSRFCRAMLGPFIPSFADPTL